MNASFDVTIKIENRSVETAFGMQEGAKNMDVNLLGQVLKIITDSQKKIKNMVDRYYGAAPETSETAGEGESEHDNPAGEGTVQEGD